MTCRQHGPNYTVSSEMPRPDKVTQPTGCDHCSATISVELQWWRCMNDGCEGKYWVLDTPGNLDRNERLCKGCLEKRMKVLDRARYYQSSTPPSDFDPTYCGERWNDDY